MLHAGIVVPTSFECDSLLALYPDLTPLSFKNSPWQIYQAQSSRRKLTVIVSFIGPANAAAACERLIAHGVDFILHGGAAGAINGQLLPGDIVFGGSCKIIVSPEVLEVRKTLLLSTRSMRYMRNGQAVFEDALAGDEKLLACAQKVSPAIQNQFTAWTAPGWPPQFEQRAPQVVTGVVGSLDGWTKGLTALQFVRDTFGCDAEDMESAYIAQTAAIHGVPQLAVRAISNNEYLGTLQKEEIIPAVKAAAERVSAVFKAMLDDLDRD